MSFSHLLSPTKIGSMELPNRVVMAPMGVELVEADGVVRQPTIDYYVERVRGGVGLIISENTSAAYPMGANSAHEIAVSDDKYLPGLTALTEAVHAAGGKIAIQLAHHGKVGRLDTIEGRELLMPSMPRKSTRPSGPLDLSMDEMMAMAKASGGGKPVIKEATHEDIAWLIEAFADAAERARRAGFDAVEIHAAHGYIFSEFHSPAWNFREDEYGGDAEGRSKLLCDVLRACKARTGGDFPIWCRLDAKEIGVENGIVVEEAAKTARFAQEAGADAIHVSAYSDPMGAGFTEGPLVHREGGFLGFASTIKRSVDVPVITAGRITVERGEEAIRGGEVDLVALGRPLLAEPELVKKLSEGRRDEIRPCIYCYVCVAQPFFDRRVKCAVNPVLAQESEFAPLLREKAPDPKRVVVVGSGPAGVEAACTAAARGHQVTLFEKDAHVGGTLRFAALPYEPNERLLDWMEARLARSNVDVRTGTPATAEAISALSPDVVLAGLGARRESSGIPGADGSHVWDGDDLRLVLAGDPATTRRLGIPLYARLAISIGRSLGITTDPSRLRSASKLFMPMGKRVTIIGGGLVGAELAEFLAERGREVTVIERGPVVALEMAHPRRWRVLHELREAGVELVTEATPLEITKDAVRFSRKGEGEDEAPVERLVPADTVVIAEGLAANPDPLEALRACGAPVVPIGDVEGVKYIEGAIHQGFRAAIEL
ncbi:MAG: FAD-dependent oxidoreductase [bacterium]|nr:FAD-dependent oxidoreductase [bacterium]